MDDRPKLELPEEKKEFTFHAVGDSNETTDETYTTKHGLTLRRSADMGNTHWSILKSMADKDPDFIENMMAGRYMPRCNGIRTVYRGKDAKLGMKVAILNFLFDPLIIMLILGLIIALIAL